MSRFGVMLAVAVLFVSVSVAQSPQPASADLVPKFTTDSGLEWRETANPAHYFDAIGRKAAVFGRQDGSLEAWVWPIKILHGFHLEFRLDNMPEPVRGEDYLQTVTVRPESTTLLYVHPSFTVKQIIWAADDRSAIVQFFDVTSDRPLDITIKFIPDFKPMWPASLGGQHSDWSEPDQAFTLTDGTNKPTAMFGSPATSVYTEFVDHSLIGGEMVLRLHTTPEQSERAFYPVVMALSMKSEADARAVYRDVLANMRPMYEAKVAHWRDFLARTLQLNTPDAELNRAFTWAKVTMEDGWVCTAPSSAPTADNPHPSVPPEGFAFPGNEQCGLVAGYGPSGTGERPGFAWWFGGDGLVSTWALLDYGDFEGAARELRFLRAHQRSDGKMMHEFVQSTGIVDWWGQYHFPYMHADTTAMYLYTLAQYWQRTGDRKFLEEFWPSAQKAYEFCVSTVDPADGLIDNTRAGLGAIEGGILRGVVKKDIYVQGFWTGGLRGMAALARAEGDTKLASDADQRLTKALETLRTKWRDPERHDYAFGVNTEGERSTMIGNWSAVLLSLGGGVGPTAADDDAAVRIFALPELATDWGSRGTSNQSKFYDPVSYSNGSVWPYGSGMVAWAQYEHGAPLAGYFTLLSVAHDTGMQAPGGMPEHMVGNRNEPGGRSVPHQLFSSWAMLRPLVAGLLGISSTADGRSTTLFFHPQLPPNWRQVSFSHLRIAGAEVDGIIHQNSGRTSIELSVKGPAPEVRITPELPYGATLSEKTLDHARVSKAGMEIDVPAGHASANATFNYRGGIGVVPVRPEPERGASNDAMKILDLTSNDVAHTLSITVAGLGGHLYDLELVPTGVAHLRVEEAGGVERTGDGFRVWVPFTGDGWVTKTLTVSY